MGLKKFEILTVPVEVEYMKPVLGRVYSIFCWLMCARVKRIDIKFINKKVCSHYCLIVPRFLKGGVLSEK